MATLHITNGDSAIPVIRAAGVGGEILPWRDVLHEGPVRAELSLEELSALRLAFLFDAYGADRERAQREFAERDALLAGAAARPEVVLWFEHDLYDQLQLIQLLDWFHTHPHPRLTLINPPEYLGMAQPQRLAELFAVREPVSDTQLALA